MSAKKAEGPTKCWLCQEMFSAKSTKIALHRHILDEMTVREAIETLLPDESITLQGTVHARIQKVLSEGSNTGKFFF